MKPSSSWQTVNIGLMRGGGAFMRIAAIVAAVSLSILGSAVADDARAAVRKPINIPAQSLVSALEALVREREIQLIYRADIIADRQSEGAAGDFTPEEALEALLGGTGLTFRYLNENTLTIVPTPAAGAPVGETSAPAKADPESEPLEEIVVSAQKREERLIDAPQSVSVLSSDYLTKIGATQFRDFASTVPGLSFSTAGAGNTQITLRGVTVGFDISPTVGIYLDEVPYGSSTVFNLAAQFALDAALFNLQRIEVLRGPQGTLYGASSMGGLIKYVTPPPDLSRYRGTAQAGVSTTRNGGTNYNVAGEFNAPLVTDRAALRVGVFQAHDGGFIDNLARGSKDVNRSDVYGGRVDLLLTPTDTLSIRLNAFLQNISRDGEGTSDYTFANTEPYGRLGQFRIYDEPLDQRFQLFSATVSSDVGWGTLTSVSSYQSSHMKSFWDISALYAPAFGVAAVGLPNNSITDKFTQELRVASQAGSLPLEWVIGGFYNHERSRIRERFALLDDQGNDVPNHFFDYYVPTTFEEHAVFGDVTWHLTGKLDVTAGVRYASSDQQFEQDGTFVLPTQTSSEDVFTYLGNARYRVNDHATAYVRFATGYRPGGPNIVTAAGGARTFASDKLKSYEIGFKGESADRRLGIDLAAYTLDWNNIQIGVIRDGFQTYTNAGGAEIRGAELALSARAVHGLTASASVAFQDACMSEADSPVLPDFPTGQFLRNRKGERLPNVPRLTAALNGDYAFADSELRPTVGATVRYVGERRASFDASANYPQYVLPEYVTVDVRAGLTLGRFAAQLFAHNLLDEHGEQSIIFPQFGARVAIVQPRTVGVNVTTEF